MKLLLALPAALLLAPTLAHAEPAHSRVSASAGIGMPEGEVGVEYAYAPQQNFEIALSGGVANLLGSGKEQSPLPQVAIMPRARLQLGRVTLALGAGVSAGQYHEGPFGFADYDLLTRAVWANGEGSVRVDVGDGWSAGLRLGLGTIVSHGPIEDLANGGHTQDCSQMTVAGGGACTSVLDTTLPYLGLSTGRSF